MQNVDIAIYPTPNGPYLTFTKNYEDGGAAITAQHLKRLDELGFDAGIKLIDQAFERYEQQQEDQKQLANTIIEADTKPRLRDVTQTKGVEGES